MKTVWLVRHGERADFNEKGEWDSEWPARAKKVGADKDDAPLTEHGKEQAIHAASRIHGELRQIYSSPFLRCIETAQIIAKVHRTELTVSTDLTEWMNPEWFKYTFEYFNKIHFSKYDAHFAPGYPIIPEEKEVTMIDRWRQVYAALKARPASNFPFMLVSHGGGIHHMLNCHDPAIMRGKSVKFADVYRMDL